MSRVYFISDGRGERRTDETALPLVLGGAERGDIVVPGLPPDAQMAVIAQSEGHVFIQPLGDNIPLFHNRERLAASAWLKSGDLIQAGDGSVSWTVEGDQVFIDATPGAAAVPPVEFEPRPPRMDDLPIAVAPGAPNRRARPLRILTVALLGMLVSVAVFLLFAVPVTLNIVPQPERLSLKGVPPPVSVLGRRLVLPGVYRLQAQREGYRPLSEALRVTREGPRDFRYTLQELPGRLTLAVVPTVAFRLLVDDAETPVPEDGVLDLLRGDHRLRIETQRYLPEERLLNVAGLGRPQSLSVTLRPAWADLYLDSRPTGAEVSVDGVPVGTTPLGMEILQGARTLVLEHAEYKPLSIAREIIAGEALNLGVVALVPADGVLRLNSRPQGASVTLGGKFMGTTPLQLALAPDQQHGLRLGRSGYRPSSIQVSLRPEEERQLMVDLEPEYGVVFLSTRPADAELLVDGKPMGRATRRLRLTTVSHSLEVRKPGYLPKRVQVTPKAGVSRTLELELVTERQARQRAMPSRIETKAGPALRLMRPVQPFVMGSSRREAGRRANENRRLIKLERPFYFGEQEVSNGAFRRFKPSHDSGTAHGAGLDGDAQPVVNLSRDDAARYCNWLSDQDGLPAAYAEKNGRMALIEPATTGYRLPTEAEWAYVARVAGRVGPATYPWAGRYPPASPAGNYADDRIADVLADVVPGYDDGYRGSAPVGSFPGNPAGMFDLGGNVAEWTNDLYAVYPGEAGKPVTDPVGPDDGGHYVIRDAGWRHGNITELRLSYRDYGAKARDDVGFRVARYAE